MENKDILELLSEVKHPARGDADVVSLGMVRSVESVPAESGAEKIIVTLAFPKKRDPLTEYLIGACRC